MKENEQNKKPFSKGKELIKTATMVLIIIAFKENLGVIDCLVPILKLVVDICVDWISKKVNDSKTNQ